MPQVRAWASRQGGGYTLGRDELVIEDVDYDQALAAARRRVPAGWRIIALRVEREPVATG
ncbi:hypothetical protein CFH99_00630 [Nocardioides aromaticivorans]|uniref:YCII-related domain-containing protein n=1 Tax=Nocardioides aromaticivorans TaxID=200618 RepID=A0ABX7PE30_9ACTN|nr:hypothetical protein CFH99_00630 [Nocardioides aromaticivorans]